jgi:tetratricopeptide (TPR) repeat protein
MSIDYKSKKFLIVDDFQEFRSSLRYMLQTFGAVSIDMAGTGDSAVTQIENKGYDVILCDYNLGYNQKDGQQILEEVKYRELIKMTAVFIMITAENTSDMIMGVAEYYPDDYLIKPFTKEVLRSRIEKAFRKKTDFEAIESAVRKQEYRRAIDLCDSQIIKEPPNLFEYMKMKGDLYLQISDYDQARKLYEEVLSIHEIPWAKIGLGRVFFQQEDYAQAREIFSSLIEENKMQIVAYDWLAKTLLKLNSPQEAQDLLQEAVEISPKSVNRQKLLGEITFQNKDYDRSEKSFQAAIALGRHSCFKSANEYTGLAKALVGKNEPQKALSILDNIEDEFPKSTEAAFQSAAMKGAVYQAMDKKEESKKYFQMAAKRFMDSGKNIPEDIAMDVAKSCLEMGEKETGLNLIQEIIKNNHEDEVLVRKVQTIFKEADLLEEGNRLIASTRKEIVRINNQGVTLVEEGKLAEAIDCFEKAAQSLPKNRIILANTVQTLIMTMQKSGKDKDLLLRAKDYLNRLQEIDPGYKKIPYLLELQEKLLVS